MSKKKHETKVCSKCEKDKRLTEYYVSASDLIHTDGKLGICTLCLISIVEFDNKGSVIATMRGINRPFLIDMYNSALKSNSPVLFREYMRLIAMPQNRFLDFGGSIFGGKGETQFDTENPSEDIQINITDDEMDYLIEFWGRGFSTEEYEFLQLEYERYLDSYEVDSRALEVIFQEASHQRLAIKRLREKGQSADKELKTLQDLLGTANVKPNQETGADATDQASFGTLIKQFENEHPIPEPSPEWKDVDGIKKYINVWFLGHLSRMMGIKNDNVTEYNSEIEKYAVEEEESDQNEFQ